MNTDATALNGTALLWSSGSVNLIPSLPFKPQANLLRIPMIVWIPKVFAGVRLCPKIRNHIWLCKRSRSGQVH